MIAILSRTLMKLAVHTLGHRRQEWALAMEAEFEAAQQDGQPLAFAFGCLIAAYRELPAHEEGRFAMASQVLALAVIVPVAALMISSLLSGFPASYLGHPGGDGLLATDGGQGPLLNEANRSAVPALAMLVLLLASLNLRIAWLALDRDWTGLASAGALSAAATAALVILSAVVFVDHVAAVAQMAVLTVELAAAWGLARWHTRSFSSGRAEPQAP